MGTRLQADSRPAPGRASQSNRRWQTSTDTGAIRPIGNTSGTAYLTKLVRTALS